ncbi:MAG: hypothetical protein WBD27_19630, partial [Pyrinomonadaceae bacterium]
MFHAIVTADNIDDAREEVTALDQRRELAVGCETWSIAYLPGSQGGWITVWPDKGRAAVCHGGDSVWGKWDANARTIHTDEEDEYGNRIVYDDNGETVTADPDCHD